MTHEETIKRIQKIIKAIIQELFCWHKYKSFPIDTSIRYTNIYRCIKCGDINGNIKDNFND